MKENFAYLKDVLGVKYLNLPEALGSAMQRKPPIVGEITNTLITPKFKIVFIGKGLGDGKDLSDLGSAGPIGKLLTNMIGAMGLKLSEVFWTQSQEMAKSLDSKIIVSFGVDSAQNLFDCSLGLEKLRGKVYRISDQKLIVTHDLDFLLKNPAEKKGTWDDLKMAMREL